MGWTAGEAIRNSEVSCNSTYEYDMKICIQSLICFVLVGCAGLEIHLEAEKSNVNLPTITYKALPLTIGLVLDQEFRNYVKTQTDTEGTTGFVLKSTLRPGPTSALVLERLTKTMFQHSEIFESFAEAYSSTSALDLIVTTDIIDVSVDLNAFPEWMKIKYSAKIYDSELNSISSISWFSRGESDEFIIGRQARLDNLLGKTLRNLPVQFAMAFEDDVGVQQWLRAKGITRLAAKLSAGSGLLVLGQDDTASFASCVENELRAAIPEITVLSARTVRDNLYPWFEADTSLSDADTMSRLLRRPGVPEKINEMGLRFIIFVSSRVSYPNKATGIPFPFFIPPYWGPFQVIWGKRDSFVSAVGWDLYALTVAAKEEVKSQDLYVSPAVTLFPTQDQRPTGDTGCAEIGKRLSEVIANAMKQK